MKRILLICLFAATSLVAADPGAVIPATDLAKKWKRNKTLIAPLEKVRKGLGIEVGTEGAAAPAVVEVRVDAESESRFLNIQFQLDSAQYQDRTTTLQLGEIAKAMKIVEMEKFLIEGHTCDLGEGAHNLLLSQHRALAVKSALIYMVVPAEQLQIIGLGEDEPAVANTDETARAQNRRVQIFRKL